MPWSDMELTSGCRAAAFAGLSCMALTALSGASGSAVAANRPVPAARASDFLDSIGAPSAISVRGENLADTAKSVRYLGMRWLRAGYEGNIPTSDLITLHRQ